MSDDPISAFLQVMIVVFGCGAVLLFAPIEIKLLAGGAAIIAAIVTALIFAFKARS